MNETAPLQSSSKLQYDAIQEEEMAPPTSDASDNNEATYWGLWKHHNEYRCYLLSSLVTNAGEWFSYIASISAVEQIHSIQNQSISRTSISILVALRLLPNALFSNLGGVLADSYDRRNMLLILDLLGAFVACFFLLAYQLQSVPGIYAATVCQMTVAAMYEPCRSALVPMLVKNEAYLKKAVTMTNLTWSVMASVGASAGGVATEYFGIDACFLVDGLTYLASAGFIWRIRGNYIAVESCEGVSVPIVPVVKANDVNCISEDNATFLSFEDATNMTIDGFSYLKSKPWGAFVFLKGSAGLIYGAAEILNVAFSERTHGSGNEINLEGSSGRLGIIYASVGVGCFLGPILSEVFTDMERPRSLEVACLISYLMMAVGYFGLSRIEGFLSICVFSSIRAAGSNIVWTYSSLLLQKFCANDKLGRVMAVDYALATMTEAVAALAGGLLLDRAAMSAEDVSYVMALVGMVTLVLWAKYFYGVRT